jgi:NitT/TauT family transport system substrate-binding protein
VALRAYLLANGLAPREMGGNVTIVPAQNPDILSLFRRGDIDGAWVPEPWATRLVKEAGGRIFLDERDLWPGGDFATAVLVVRTEFLDKHPQAVEALLRAHVEATRWIQAHPDEAKQSVNEGIRQATGVALPADVLDAAWEHLRFTYDPIPSSLRKAAADAHRLGFLEDEPDLRGMFALDTLNRVLRESGLPQVSP